jgi:hypothetical protein
MKSTDLQSVFVACVISLIQVCAFADPVRVALQPAKNHQGNSSLKKLCVALSTPCQLSTTQAYQDPDRPEAYLWLIDESKPMLAKLALDQTQLQVLIELDFKNRVHSAPFSRPNEEPMVIDPALYLTPTGEKAVALLISERTGYSGGGKMDTLADFIVISSQTVGSDAGDNPSAIYQSVPFESSGIIRACFTKNEYADTQKKKRRSCHDEFTDELLVSAKRAGNKTQPWVFKRKHVFLSAETRRKDKTELIVMDIPLNESATHRHKRVRAFLE